MDVHDLRVNDWIHISYEEARLFLSIAKDTAVRVGSEFAVPGDILLSRTIPLRDFVLQVESLTFRLNFPDGDFDGDIRNLPENGIILMGRITYFSGHDTLSADCCIKKGSIGIAINERFLRNGVRETENHISSLSAADRELHNGSFKNFHGVLAVWYGIQIAMLNPHVKNVFRTENVRKTGFNPNGKKCKAIVRYVRHHYLNPEAVSPKTETGQQLRKTMAWYVCGHWRHCKSGVTTFVQPYWKGPLRKTKACDPRERVIV